MSEENNGGKIFNLMDIRNEKTIEEMQESFDRGDGIYFLGEDERNIDPKNGIVINFSKRK